MGVDLTTVPWVRLSRLAPPATPVEDLQAAADRWALRADVYNAAADLWEEAALAIDTTPTEVVVEGTTPTGAISSVSQDGISVTYANDALAGNGLTARIAQRGQMLSTVRRLRAKGKPVTPLVHDPDYDPWLNTDQNGYTETIIVVDEV